MIELYYPYIEFLVQNNNSTFGANVKDLQQLMENFSNTLGPFTLFIQIATMICGVGLIMKGLLKLKHLADMRNMMSGQAEVGKAIGVILAGVGLIWLPYLIRVFSFTIFGSDDYNVPNVQSNAIKSFYVIMRFIGIISIIKGWFLCASMGKGQAQPGTAGKAASHLIGGIMMYHLDKTVVVVTNTLGLSGLQNNMF